jgi:hypothetical protein
MVHQSIEGNPPRAYTEPSALPRERHGSAVGFILQRAFAFNAKSLVG